MDEHNIEEMQLCDKGEAYDTGNGVEYDAELVLIFFSPEGKIKLGDFIDKTIIKKLIEKEKK